MTACGAVAWQAASDVTAAPAASRAEAGPPAAAKAAAASPDVVTIAASCARHLITWPGYSPVTFRHNTHRGPPMPTDDYRCLRSTASRAPTRICCVAYHSYTSKALATHAETLGKTPLATGPPCHKRCQWQRGGWRYGTFRSSACAVAALPGSELDRGGRTCRAGCRLRMAGEPGAHGRPGQRHRGRSEGHTS